MSEALAHPPFEVGDRVSIRRDSRLQENAKFMQSDVFEVLECLQTIHKPAPVDGWIIRIKRPEGDRTPIVPLSPQECFDACEFEHVAAGGPVRYVRDVKLSAAGILEVVYGELQL